MMLTRPKRLTLHTARSVGDIASCAARLGSAFPVAPRGIFH